MLKKEAKTEYPGIWLPEPLPEHNWPDSTHQFEQRDRLTYELVWLLQSVRPVARAVFILRAAFDLSHAEIGEVLEISPENARQQFVRTRKLIENHRHQPNHLDDQLSKAKKMVDLIIAGEVEALIRLFNEDIVSLGDGGGKVHAARIPVEDARKVAQFLVNISRKSDLKLHFKFLEIQRQPAIAIFQEDRCLSVQILSFKNGKVSRIFNQLNPDKLTNF